MDILTILATVFTIETGVIFNVKGVVSLFNKHKSKNLAANIDYNKIAKDLVTYAELADKYVTEVCAKGTKVISNDERAKFIKTFYATHPCCGGYRKEIDPILDSYLDRLTNILGASMSTGEKFLNMKVDDIKKLCQNEYTIIRNMSNDIENLKSDTLAIKHAIIKSTEEIEQAMTVIDNKFVEDNKTEEKERCMFNYYRNGDPFPAVINDVIVTTNEYEDICNRIFETAKNTTALFILADGGTGKSTILCKIALKALGDGYKIYFSNSKLENVKIDSICEDTFFILDNAEINCDFVDTLYGSMKKNRFIHTILADRTHRINTMMSNLSISMWDVSKKAYIIKNDVKQNYTTALRPSDVEEIVLSEELRKNIANKAIDVITENYGWNSEYAKVVECIKTKLSYTSRSVNDILIDFLSNFHKTTKVRLPFDLDWDKWGENPVLNGTFKYLAALIKYGVCVNIYQIEELINNRINLRKYIDEDKLTVIRCTENGIISFCHDTVADNFFVFQHINAYDVIVEMLEKRLFTEDTVVSFEKEVFSLSNIFNPTSEVECFRIPDLIARFNRIDEYREILTKHQRIHSLELATLAINKNVKRIGESYIKIQPKYSNQLQLWIKYFFFSVNSSETIPIQMLDILKSEPGLYKKVTSVVDNYLKRVFRHFDIDDKNRWVSHCEELFCWIIDNINKDDIPSRIILLRIYRYSGEVNKAKDMICELSRFEKSNAQFCEFSIADIQTYETEVRELIKNDRNDRKIRRINRFIWQCYDKLIVETPKNTNEYIMVIRNFVRFHKNTKHYDQAYKLAKDTIEHTDQIVPVYFLYIELGMICQIRSKRNPYYDQNAAINWFKKAVAEMDNSSRELLYALKPMCKSYLQTKCYDECIHICDRIKNIDFRDKEADIILFEAKRLKKIKDENLPVGERFEFKNNPCSEMIEREMDRLIEEMTEEQISYVELLGLKEYRCKPMAYKAALSIKNNTHIPISTLSKLSIAKR